MCDMRRVLGGLRGEELGGLLEEGVRCCSTLHSASSSYRYYRTLPSSTTAAGALYSWEKTFPSHTREQVEEVLGGLGYSTEWTEEGALRWPSSSSPPPAPAPQVLLPDVGGAGAPEHRGGGVV